jgi:molybdopterin-guanine dinucleotide biosynthesis protein A
MITHTIGAVLAGGASSRMGSDKAALEYGDAPFIEHVIATMSLAVDEIVVCGGEYDGPAIVLPDAFHNAGPLAGILAAFEHAGGRPIVVVPTDMPLVTVELIRRLADPQLNGAEARLARAGDQIQPLCAAYGPEVISIVEDRVRGSHRSAMGLIDALTPVTYIESDARTLMNVNTPEDYEMLIGEWQQ